MVTDFWKKYLDQTLYAIGEIAANRNGSEITVKKIGRCTEYNRQIGAPSTFTPEH